MTGIRERGPQPTQSPDIGGSPGQSDPTTNGSQPDITIEKLMEDATQSYSKDRLFTTGHDALHAALQKIPAEKHEQIAEWLIHHGYAGQLAVNLEKFSNLDSGIARTLIKEGYKCGYYVLHNPDKFSGINHTEIAKLLIENEQAYLLVEDLNKLSNLDVDIVKRLIRLGEDGQGELLRKVQWQIAENLDRFSNLDAEVLRFLLLKNFYDVSGKVLEHLNRFSGIDYNEIAKILISISRQRFIENIDKFSNLGSDIAKELIFGWGYNKNQIRFVLDNINRFSNLGTEIARVLIEKGFEREVLGNLGKFTGIDAWWVVQELIYNASSSQIYSILSLSEELSIPHAKIAQVLIDGKQYIELVENLEKFIGVDNSEIARLLIEDGAEDIVTFHLAKFKGIDNNSIATLIIEKGDIGHLSENLAKFPGLDASVTRLFVQRMPNASAFIAELTALGVWKESFYDNFEICVAFVEMAQDAEANLALLKTRTFLLDAIESNLRDAPRLIAEFPNLDKDSQENIEKLYEIKKSAGIDPEKDPVEYRKFVQGRLLDYKNNKEIYYLASARVGRPIDTWLNYGETEDFTLGAEREIPFTEMVRTPVTRIEETFEIYGTMLKRELGEYRTPLLESKIRIEDVSFLKEEERKMRDALEKARADGNEKKVRGIEKGLSGLENRINNPKMIALWDKIVGDYGAVTLLQRDVIVVNDAIKTVEEKEKSLASETLSVPERRKKVRALKAEREALENQFKEKLGTMHARFEVFQSNLPGTLISAINQESVDKLLQKVREGTSEPLEHYKTDLNTLNMILLDDGKKEHLGGRSMSIELWNRDPDVNLYLGNYTSCCVAIDNEIHGENSPISDYLTDVGMQVITITDQKRQRPVVAAWCYIGTDKDKNVALVIDNIEADTAYSIPFKEQLENKMRQYVNAYAKASGLNLVSQGPHNNDLEVAPLEEKYTKLGGYNIKDGYYLEAEPEQEDQY